MRLLLIEDDDLLGDGIRAGLMQSGSAVDWATDGEEGVEALASSEYDAVILDLGLPKIGGTKILERMRREGNTTPVLILTARDTVADRVAGLDGGADDYVVKPFDMGELLARLRALVRRREGRAAPLLQRGSVVLDPGAHTVTQEGEAVELSPREFAVLQELMENAGRVLSRERLEEKLYGWDDEIASNAIEVHIHHLRRKLGTSFIRTIRGVGYMVEGELP